MTIPLWLAVSAALAQYAPPSESQGGWRTLVPLNGTPSAAQKADVLSKAGLDWDKLRDAWAYTSGFGGANSVLVIRNGWIAGEWSTFSGTTSIASCQKSLTSLALAKVFDLSAAGKTLKAIGPDSFAYLYLPATWGNAEPARKQVRLRHLLTMSSGLAPFDGPYDAYTESLVLSRRVEAAPEKVWAYSSSEVDVLSLIVENVTGKTLQAFFTQEIAGPIGLGAVTWESFSGHTKASAGLKMSARDLARVGYLLLRGGTWGVAPVLSSARVTTHTSWAPFLSSAVFRVPQAQMGSDPTRFFANDPQTPQYYGWLFWTNRTGAAMGAAAPRDAAFMDGWGKQACFVVPSLDLVVVRLGAKAALNDVRDYWPQFWSRLLKAVASAPPPPSNAPPTVAITSPAPGAAFTIPASIPIQAQASDSNGSVAKVEFFADGAFLGQDASSPYSFTWSGASAGSHVLTARATDNGGATATSAAVTVTVNGSGAQAVTSLTLVNADSNLDVGPLSSGAVLDLSKLPPRLNVRANTSPSTVGSVRFALDGNPNFRTESTAPYALAGDTAGDYWPWTPAVGAHSLTATPWTGAGATGAAGTAKTVTFTVTGSATALAFEEADPAAADLPRCGALGLEVLILLGLTAFRRNR
jgi:CubicO group peptidase (beta-lactamase class C family)